VRRFSAALQRRVCRGHSSRLSRCGQRPQRLKRFFFLPLYAGLKAGTNRTGGYTNFGTALAQHGAAGGVLGKVEN